MAAVVIIFAAFVAWMYFAKDTTSLTQHSKISTRFKTNGQGGIVKSWATKSSSLIRQR